MSTYECPPTPPIGDPIIAAKTPPPKSPQKSDEESERPKNTEDERPSSPVACAICLGKLENMSYTDSCFHKFCFVCLVEWSKVSPKMSAIFKCV
jgi:E3 ubiquitin-protein ligase Topors